MTNFYLSMAPHLIFLPSTQNFFNSHDTTRLHSRASSKVQNNRKILHPRPVNFKLVGKPENHKWLGSDLLKKMSHNGSKTSLKSYIFFLKVSFIVQLCKRLKWSAHEMVSRLVFSFKESWIHKICLALIKINGYFDIFLFILILTQKSISKVGEKICIRLICTCAPAKALQKLSPSRKTTFSKPSDVKIKTFKKFSWNGWDVKIRVQLQKILTPLCQHNTVAFYKIRLLDKDDVG